MERPAHTPGLFIRKMIDDLFISKSGGTLIQFFRYTFAGGIAFLADFGSLYVLTEFLHVHYLVSAAMAYLLGVFTKYAMCIIWVFHRRSMESPWLEFVIFGAIGVTGFGLNMVFMWFFTEKAQVHYLASKVISAVAVFCWNFFTRKMTLFN
ncbi:MAG TPA: GtrA family protein [Desulfomonilia bacterium]|nr:GtrA family protein [Desulfomonilia bacterium]